MVGRRVTWPYRSFQADDGSHTRNRSLSPLWTLTTTLVATSCQSAMVSWLLSMYRWKWVTLSVAATRA